MSNSKQRIMAVLFSAALAVAVLVPAAFADDGGNSGQLSASDSLAAQSSNTVQATAEEINLGGTAGGQFELDEYGLACNTYWYKFKTADEAAGYRVKFEMLFDEALFCRLYDEYGDLVESTIAQPTSTITVTDLNKNTWYYARVGWPSVREGLQGKGFRVSVEKFDTDLAHANVALDASLFTYDGRTKRPGVTVELGGSTLGKDSDYSVTYANNINPGTATVTVAGRGYYRGEQTVQFTIDKAGNTMKASGKKVTLRANANALQKKRTITKSRAFSVRGANGVVRFAKKSGNKKISVSKTGKVTVKKGLKKGTYKVKVRVKAAGDTYHKSSAKTVTLTVKVRK